MILLVSVCNISWWMALVAMAVPTVLSWYLANLFAADKKEKLRRKIVHLTAELKKQEEKKQVMRTKLVTPVVKFSEIPAAEPVNSISRKTESAKRPGSANSLKPRIASTARSTRVDSVKIPEYPRLRNNMEIIEGIGPKMRQVLEDNGIDNWAILADMTAPEIKGVLNKYGDKYRIIDPRTWPLQAELALQNKWDKLVAQQESEGGKTGSTGSKFAKMLVRFGYVKKFKQDDLKAIEGIGPKIAILLNDAGIQTWSQLAEANVEEIKNILEHAGKHYALATPDFWPDQARLAADGDFGGLEIMQTQLKQGIKV